MTALTGRVAVLTGATGGLGRPIARRLALAGADLALCGRDRAALDALCGELRPLGVRCTTVVADLRDPAAPAAILADAQRALGAVDLVVANAGIEVCSGFEHTTPEEVRDVVAVNLVAPIELARLAIPGMLDRGRGHVVLVSSLSGVAGTAYEAVYAATKGGLNALGASLRAEYAGRPVGVSVVAPGPVAAAGMFARGVEDGIVVPRALQPVAPQEVAEAVVEAIATDAPQVLVARGPVRGSLALAALAPRLSERLTARLGRGDLFRPAAVTRGRAQP